MEGAVSRLGGCTKYTFGGLREFFSFANSSWGAARWLAGGTPPPVATSLHRGNFVFCSYVVIKTLRFIIFGVIITHRTNHRMVSEFGVCRHKFSCKFKFSNCLRNKQGIVRPKEHSNHAESSQKGGRTRKEIACKQIA